jgi:HK97 family phage portal protein
MAMEMKFLSGAFSGVRKTKAGSAVEHAISGTPAATMGGLMSSVFDSSRAGWDFQQAVDNALEKVIWVFRCVDAIATNASGQKLTMRQGDPYEGKIVDLDDILNRLLNGRANIYETSDEFRYRMAAQLLLSKRGAFIEMEKNDYGDVIALHLIPPHMCEPIPDKKTFVSGYRVQLAGGGYDELPKEKVIWVRVRPHPLDPYSQMTPLMAATLAVETDWLARIYNRNFLMNDGRPALLIALQGEVNPDTAKEIKQRMNGGSIQAGRTVVLEADGISQIDLGSTPHEVQWLEAIRGSKEDILLAFGTPESVLGNASGRTFDNADAEREGWWKDTMVPFCNRIARGLDILTGDVNDDKYIAYDYSKIDVLQRAIKAREEQAQAKFAAGLITLDQYMEIVGRDPLKVAGARVHFLPNGLIVGKDDADVEMASKLPNLLAGTPPQAGDPAESARAGATEGATLGIRNFNNEFSARVQRLMSDVKTRRDKAVEKKSILPGLEDNDNVLEGTVVLKGAAPYEDVRLQFETQLTNIIGEWDVKQASHIVTRLGHAGVLKYTRHWVGEQPLGFDPTRGYKALDPKKVVDVDRWKADLKQQILVAAIPVVRRELKRVAQEMDSSGVTKVMIHRGLGNAQGGSSLSRVYGTTQQAEKAVSDVLAPLERIIDAAADRQTKRVMAMIRDMDARGAQIGQIKDAVNAMIGTRAGWKTGLSEFVSGSAIEGIRAKTYANAGPIVKKIWVTVGDEHTRPTHRKADQQEKPNTGRFKVGKYLMSHPGDPTAGPEETASCRCWLEFEVSDRYAEIYDELAA